MLQSGFRTLVAAFVGAAAMGAVAPVASASPPSGVTVESLAAGDLDDTLEANHDRVKFQTKDPTDLRMQRLTFGAGSTSGWHHHPGVVLVVVQSGSLTLWHTDCSTETYGPGSPNGKVFIEHDDVPHQATSETGATAYVTYVVPSEDPAVLRVEEPAQSCQ